MRSLFSKLSKLALSAGLYRPNVVGGATMATLYSLYAAVEEPAYVKSLQGQLFIR